MHKRMKSDGVGNRPLFLSFGITVAEYGRDGDAYTRYKPNTPAFFPMFGIGQAKTESR